MTLAVLPAWPRKGNRACEYKFATQVAQLLQQFCRPEWRYTHLPFGEKRDPKTARKLKLMGVTPGWPDFMLVGPGKVCFLELKSKTGQPSAAQSAIAGHLMACGCGYGLTSSFDDVVAMLQDWGVIGPEVHVQ
jgi:hypothetical protein